MIETTSNYSDLDENSRRDQRKVVVFDMDGTLYKLDGENSGYHGSALEKIVLQNAKNFVAIKEGCLESKAEELITEVLKETIDLSKTFSQKYGVTRADYLNVVWDIHPEGIVRDFEDAVGIVRQLSESNYRLILLTSSPKVWQKRVLEFLGITDQFSEVYTTEDFSHKAEIFEILGQNYGSENIISVGDQFHTDIEPARNLGIRTYWINDTNQIKNLNVEN